MRLETLPESMVVVGGGYIAVEMSHIFGAFGTRVTIIARGDTLLAKHDLDIRRRFTERYLQRFDLKLSARVDKVAMGDTDVRVSFTSSGRSQSVEAEILLIAVGRKPNGDRLGLDAAGIDLDDDGRVKIDDYYQTSIPGIWSFGDLSNHFDLKHMANAEGRVVRHNLLDPFRQEKLPCSSYRRLCSPNLKLHPSDRPKRSCTSKAALMSPLLLPMSFPPPAGHMVMRPAALADGT
jgi:mycothione reductase